MNIKKIIKNIIFEYLVEANQYDNLVVIHKVDQIRAVHRKLDDMLSDGIFKHKGVYIKGGAARIALGIYFNKSIDTIIRDVDYCFIGDHTQYLKLINKTKLDVSYEADTIANYFKSRDITLNEVLISPNVLICTRRAYRDYDRKVINPKHNYLKSRMVSRILLFAARYGYTIPPSIESAYIYDFDFLVCLLKAYEIGIQEKYYLICRKYGITDEASLPEWLSYLLQSVYEFALDGREKYIAKDIAALKDVEKTLYNMYPDLKREVEDLNIHDENYLTFFKKRNRISKTQRTRY